MNKKKDPKLIYAQSSDIKSRTYLEYRKDMKKKAIVELEIIEWLEQKLKEEPEIKKWLENKLKEKLDKKKISVKKHGGDKFLWFLRKGGITRDPDFVVYINEEKKLFIEFQYADKEDLQFFDFKISKVTKKTKNGRITYENKIFLYILKNSLKYAFITPEWIANRGKIDVVSAWGNQQAYRVPKKEFEKILKKDEALKPFVITINAKITILNFQHRLISIWKDELSKELQKLIDEKKVVKIIPKTLEGFFKVCFILDHLDEIPENIKLWFIYLLSHVNEKLPLKDIAMLTYSLDFLYTKIPPGQIKSNELMELKEKIRKLINLINSYYDDKKGLYKSSIKESPLEETRYALFSINLIEDIIQDAIYYHNAELEPITKIYQNVKDPIKIAERITSQL